jgi:hypothetical protein
MNDWMFQELIEMVTPLIKMKYTNMRQSILVEEILAVTLRYLATGRSFQDLKFSAIIAPNTISGIIIKTCEIIIEVLKDCFQVC